MTLQGTDFTKDDFASLLLRSFYPERTDRESRVIRDYLINHGAEFDRFTFSAHIGQGAVPDPTLPLRLQKQIAYVSQKRIDGLFWSGSQPTIIEVKYLVTPASLGQILAYRLLLREELPDAPEPQLVVIGAAGDPETIRILNAHGITVYIYPEADTSGGAAASPV
jgi:hypothetical protein